jgi:hypothetical protein
MKWTAKLALGPVARGGKKTVLKEARMSRLPLAAVMILSLGLADTAVAATAAEEPPAQERLIIADTIRDSIAWALTKDRPRLESILSHDERLFIFNPDSQNTVGWSGFVKLFEFFMDPRFKATKTDIREMRIDLARCGDVAWWSCILDDLGEWAGKPTGWKDTRWTGVLEKRDGKWVIVQMHFSFAVDKVKAEYKAKLEAEREHAGAAKK